jgi:hypothetical protein
VGAGEEYLRLFGGGAKLRSALRGKDRRFPSIAILDGFATYSMPAEVGSVGAALHSTPAGVSLVLVSSVGRQPYTSSK